MPRPRTQSTPFLVEAAEELAHRLVGLRKARGLTQKELAEKVGITRDLLARIEGGGTRMSDLTVIQFAKALKISTDELLGVSGGEQVRGTDSVNLRLVQRMQKIQQLPMSEQKVLLRTIDNFLRGSGIDDERMYDEVKYDPIRKVVTVIQEVEGPPPQKASTKKLKAPNGQPELLPAPNQS
jgi:transcriptional regulator with XRE-family HTH domain